MPEQFRGQRSLITVVFSDLCGSTRISSIMEPEDFSAAVDMTRREFHRIVEKHGGTVIRHVGDGIFFAFGYPVSYSDNSRRAIDAVLELHDVVRRLEPLRLARNARLRLHSGIHSGIVLIRSGGASTGAYDMLGEAINIAAKLSDEASEDEILITEGTLGGDRHSYQASEIKRKLISGYPSPLLCRSLYNRKSEAQALPYRLEYQTTLFTGRSKQLSHLVGFVESQTATERILLVQAEAGMGKSRLLHELAKLLKAKDYEYHIGHCDAYVGSLSLQPIRQIVLSLVQSKFGLSEADLKTDIYPYLPEPNRIRDLARNEVASTAQETDAFASLINDLCKETHRIEPTVIAMDDWQWSDTASQRVVQQLMASDQNNVLLVLASRENDSFLGDALRAKTMPLPPLETDAIESTARRLLPGIDPFTSNRIIAASGGNPLFIEELCHSVQHSQNTDVASTGEAWLEGLVHERYSRLPNRLAKIVQAAAIIGLSVPVWLLEAVIGNSISNETMSQLQDADFLFSTEQNVGLKFKHGLTRQAVYGIINLADRRRLHRKTAEELLQHSLISDAVELSGLLAHHYSNCDDREPAIRYSILAGETALRNASLDQAQRYFRIAFEQIYDREVFDPRGVDVIRKYGAACVVDPSREQLTLLKNAVEWAQNSGSKEALAWSQCWLGSIYYGLGEPAKALEHFYVAQQSSDVSSALNLNAQIDAGLGQAYVTAGQYTPAFKHLTAAISKKSDRRSGAYPSSSLSYAMSCKGFALADQGYFDEAETLFEQARSVMQGTSHEAMMSILAHEAAARLWMGQFEATDRLYSQVISMSVAMRSRYHHAMSTAIKAAARFYQDGDPTQIQVMKDATNWMISSESQQYISLNFGYLADASAQTGVFDDARHFAAQALMRARKGDRFGESISYRALAVMSHRTGAHDAKRAYLAKARKSALRRQSSRELQLLQHLSVSLSEPDSPNTINGPATERFEPNRFYPYSLAPV